MTISPRLIQILKDAGDEYGPLGVALAAASLTDPQVLIWELQNPDPVVVQVKMPKPVEDSQ